ncbi:MULTISPECIES: DUF2788 domain-containing protein [unclassified Moraxella]|uniref:DUF2788 domain-containing protein n=1 Tax=unclassified Moraxella TaxID=2685852 RepID=UPI003AF6F78A
MFVLVSNEMITNLGMWLVVPAFIAFLFFIMWDISKKSNAGKAGTFWIFIALGGGFFGYLIKLLIQWYFERHL